MADSMEDRSNCRLELCITASHPRECLPSLLSQPMDSCLSCLTRHAYSQLGVWAWCLVATLLASYDVFQEVLRIDQEWSWR